MVYNAFQKEKEKHCKRWRGGRVPCWNCGTADVASEFVLTEKKKRPDRDIVTEMKFTQCENKQMWVARNIYDRLPRLRLAKCDRGTRGPWRQGPEYEVHFLFEPHLCPFLLWNRVRLFFFFIEYRRSVPGRQTHTQCKKTENKAYHARCVWNRSTAKGGRGKASSPGRALDKTVGKAAPVIGPFLLSETGHFRLFCQK